MVAVALAADQPFFAEWPGDGRRRSLHRARALGELLGISWPLPVPVITVVGSKGKGTAVAHASSVLAAAGLRVGTITSPPFRRNTERIRINGTALELADFENLSARVSRALKLLPPSTTEYLAPTGIFTVAGVSELLRRGVSALVLEEGLGGCSDEVSLFPSKIVVLTPVFEEHLGIIGNSLPEIAADLLGVCGEKTELLVTTPQVPEVRALFPGSLRNIEIFPASLPEGYRRCAPGPSAVNAAAGATAGNYLAKQLTAGLSISELAAAAYRVILPGRLSSHPPNSVRAGTWILDAAINPAGISAVAQVLTEENMPPKLVLACFPDAKDAAACFARAQREFGDIIPVTSGAHLRFEHSGQSARPAIEAIRSALPQPGPVLALGTMSFIADATELLDIATDSWWQ